jgi:hypothetical protein
VHTGDITGYVRIGGTALTSANPFLATIIASPVNAAGSGLTGDALAGTVANVPTSFTIRVRKSLSG